MTKTAMTGFTMNKGQDDYVSFTNGEVTLVRFRPFAKWEFYTVAQKGRYRGMETFVRYLSDEEAARLDVVVDWQETKPADDEMSMAHTRAVAALKVA